MGRAQWDPVAHPDATSADATAATFTGSVTPARLAEGVGGRVGRVVDVRRTWFDTFDWRLWNRALSLEVDQAPAMRTLTLRSAHDHRVQWVQRGGDVPSGAGALPAGPWRRSLAGVLGIRALVPMGAEQLEMAEIACPDREGKTVATLLWESVLPAATAAAAPAAAAAAAAAPGGAPSPEPRLRRLGRVRLVPTRGYDKAARELARLLQDRFGLLPASGHPLQDAAPFPPGDDPGKLRLSLDPRMRADQAVYLMLSTLFATMGLNEPWLARAPDTEFLHDYRVALRRSRSVLKQARGILADDTLRGWRPALRDLQVRTNGHRDLDVFLLEFDSYRAAVPEMAEGDLEPLRDLLLRHQAEEHDGLVRYLGGKEHRALLEGYGAFLRRGPEDGAGAGASQAALPVGQVAAGRIRRAHRRLLSGGSAIDGSSPAEALHELRIRGKELRYLLELYASLYDPSLLGGAVRELKLLQDNLGEFQDCEVHAQRLHVFAEELRASPGVATSSLMAVALVARGFTGRQARARAAFSERFSAFAGRRNRRALDGMLTTGAGPR